MFLKLYSIISEQAYLSLKKNGYLRCDGRFISKDFREAYLWLSNFMENKVIKPDIKIKYPLWTWYKYGNRNKPNIKNKRYNKNSYLVGLKQHKDHCLLSSFEAWHFVLNNSFFPCSEYDWNLSEIIEEYNPQYFEKMKVNSWKKIFELKNLEQSYLKYIQATVWEINTDNIFELQKIQ